VEEIGGEHRRGLRAQELPPRRVGAPLRRRGIFKVFRIRRMVDALTRWPSLGSSPWILLYPQPWFSVASRSISAAISALTGGRPVRLG
jgi:hypothetical protein